MRRRSLGVHVAMKHRRRWTTALAMTAVLAVAIWLWLSRGESVSAVIAREGRPWLVVESATMERRFGGAILPSTYLVLRGAREWNPAIDPMSGTTLVYTADQSVRIYWRQRVEGGRCADQWFALGSEPQFECFKIDQDGWALEIISRRFFNVEVSAQIGAY